MIIMLWFACTIISLHLIIMASFSHDSDCDSPRPKEKLLGSATYNCNDSLWKKSFPCIEEVRMIVLHFICTCCLKKLSCKHMGKRHIQGASHEKASKGMEMQKKSFYIHFHVTFIFDESQAFLGLITLILNSGLGRSEVRWSLPNRGAPAPVPPDD